MIASLVPEREVHVLYQRCLRFVIRNREVVELFLCEGIKLSKVPQGSASNDVKVRETKELRKGGRFKRGKNKCSGQPICKPKIGQYAVDSSTLRFQSGWPLRCLVNVGVPFSDVSFRAFTASPTVEKGTPTIQLFDNRSIA